MQDPNDDDASRTALIEDDVALMLEAEIAGADRPDIPSQGRRTGERFECPVKVHHVGFGTVQAPCLDGKASDRFNIAVCGEGKLIVSHPVCQQ